MELSERAFSETCSESAVESTLDDRYEVQVVRVAPYQGKLLIREAGEEISSQRVGLMFDSLVGPVAADLDVWEEMAIDAINNRSCYRHLPMPAGTRLRAQARRTHAI